MVSARKPLPPDEPDEVVEEAAEAPPPAPPREAPKSVEVVDARERRDVIGLTNRNSIVLPDGSVFSVRLGQRSTMPAKRAAELVKAGLVAYV